MAAEDYSIPDPVMRQWLEDWVLRETLFEHNCTLPMWERGYTFTMQGRRLHMVCEGCAKEFVT